MRFSVRRVGLRLQGWYYIATGLWPLVSMRTFETVTGPKVEDWLVRSVGLQAFSIGVGLLVASRAPAIPAATRTIAVLAAASFTVIDVVYFLNGTLPWTYLLDAAAELTFIGAQLGRGEPEQT